MGWDGWMDGIYLRQLGTLEHLAVLINTPISIIRLASTELLHIWVVPLAVSTQSVLGILFLHSIEQKKAKLIVGLG